MQIVQNRRDFLAGLSGAGASGILGPAAALAEDGPPETTTIKLAYYSNNCLAPLLVAEDLLRAEGFTEGSGEGVGKMTVPARDHKAQ
jgi:NitT/TauT family transport system substrate-binding protein